MSFSSNIDKHREFVQQTLAQHDIGDPADLLCALLTMLEERHVTAIYADSGKAFNDGLDNVTGRHAISHADGLRNLAATYSVCTHHNSQVDGVSPADSVANERMSRLTRCVADLFDAVLPGWEAEGERLKAMLANLPQHVSPREGDPIDQPWEGKPVDFNGKPTDDPWDGRTIPDPEK